MNALMSITAGQDSDARTHTSDGALATHAVMRTSANGTTQRLEAWGYSALSLPEWYSLRSDASAAGSTCTPDATLAPQHLWRYRYGPQQEREQKREWENGTATQPLHWTYWLLGADGKQLATYHGVQGGATCGGAATDVALWPVEYAAYAPLGARVITRSNGMKEIVLADHLGSSRVVLSQQGYIAQSTAYTAYGEISHSEGDGARTGYIGRFAEPEGSFNLHGVRFYDPDVGSFTAVDPLWAKYAAWTPYQYAGNQPLTQYDQNGLWVQAMSARARDAIKASVPIELEKWIDFDDNGVVIKDLILKGAQGHDPGSNIAILARLVENTNTIEVHIKAFNEYFTALTSDGSEYYESLRRLSAHFQDGITIGYTVIPRADMGVVPGVNGPFSTTGNIQVVIADRSTGQLNKTIGQSTAHELYGHARFVLLWRMGIALEAAHVDPPYEPLEEAIRRAELEAGR